MEVEIWLERNSQAITHKSVISTYQKGGFFCVKKPKKVYKYPVTNIFCITESDFALSHPDK